MKNTTKLSNVVLAAAAGLATGGALGILFAPEKGRKTRKKISKKGKNLLGKIDDHMSKEKLKELKKEVEEQLDKVNEKIKDFAGTV